MNFFNEKNKIKLIKTNLDSPDIDIIIKYQKPNDTINSYTLIENLRRNNDAINGNVITNKKCENGVCDINVYLLVLGTMSSVVLKNIKSQNSDDILRVYDILNPYFNDDINTGYVIVYLYQCEINKQENICMNLATSKPSDDIYYPYKTFYEKKIDERPGEYKHTYTYHIIPNPSEVYIVKAGTGKTEIDKMKNKIKDKNPGGLLGGKKSRRLRRLRSHKINRTRKI